MDSPFIVSYLCELLQARPAEATPVGSKIGTMDGNSRANAGLDCSRKVKKLGWELTACSVLALLIGLISITNLGNEGEIGRFAHYMEPMFLSMVVWGVATGIGLLWSWRWARISMLVFSSFPIVLGILLAVGLLLLPKGDMSGWSLILLKTVAVSLDLIPIAIGVRWLNFFRRDDVKSYFRA